MKKIFELPTVEVECVLSNEAVMTGDYWDTMGASYFPQDA